jgi:hypothetical protein
VRNSPRPLRSAISAALVRHGYQPQHAVDFRGLVLEQVPLVLPPDALDDVHLVAAPNFLGGQVHVFLKKKAAGG